MSTKLLFTSPLLPGARRSSVAGCRVVSIRYRFNQLSLQMQHAMQRRKGSWGKTGILLCLIAPPRRLTLSCREAPVISSQDFTGSPDVQLYMSATDSNNTVWMFWLVPTRTCVQQHFLPDIILLTQCYYHRGTR